MLAYMVPSSNGGVVHTAARVYMLSLAGSQGDLIGRIGQCGPLE